MKRIISIVVVFLCSLSILNESANAAPGGTNLYSRARKARLAAGNFNRSVRKLKSGEGQARAVPILSAVAGASPAPSPSGCYHQHYNAILKFSCVVRKDKVIRIGDKDVRCGDVLIFIGGKPTKLPDRVITSDKGELCPWFNNVPSAYCEQKLSLMYTMIEDLMAMTAPWGQECYNCAWPECNITPIEACSCPYKGY